MSKKSNEEKSKRLGINYGTATNRLKKNILFRLAEKCGETSCFRCGKQIENSNDLSVDHKVDWLNSEEEKELFWDLGNIAFSHKSCNSLAGLDKTTTHRGTTRLKNKRNKQFQSRYWNGKKQVFVGYFDTAEEAKIAAEKGKL